MDPSSLLLRAPPTEGCGGALSLLDRTGRRRPRLTAPTEHLLPPAHEFGSKTIGGVASPACQESAVFQGKSPAAFKRSTATWRIATVDRIGPVRRWHRWHRPPDPSGRRRCRADGRCPQRLRGK